MTAEWHTLFSPIAPGVVTACDYPGVCDSTRVRSRVLLPGIHELNALPLVREWGVVKCSPTVVLTLIFVRRWADEGLEVKCSRASGHPKLEGIDILGVPALVRLTDANA